MCYAVKDFCSGGTSAKRVCAEGTGSRSATHSKQSQSESVDRHEWSSFLSLRDPACSGWATLFETRGFDSFEILNGVG